MESKQEAPQKNAAPAYFWSIQTKTTLIISVVIVFLVAITATGIYGLGQVRSVSDVIVKENPAIRSVQEALVALSTGHSTLERLLDIEALEEGGFEEQYAKFIEARERFTLFMAAVTWGSESEAFRLSANGRNLALWRKAGLEGEMVVPPPDTLEAQFAGQSRIYFEGFVNNAENAIEAYRVHLTREEMGQDAGADEMLAQEYMSKARRYVELTVERLTNIVAVSNTRSEAQFARLAETQEFMRSLVILISAAAIAALFIVSFLFVRRFLLMPIRALASAARKLGAGDFTTRVHLQTRDELQTLATTFNAMADNLSAHTAELERKVFDRTRELAEKMGVIKEQLDERRRIAEDLDRSGKMLIRRDLELSRANEQLRSIDKMKSDFVSVVTHQLRTPLSAMKWAMSMLLQKEFGELNPDQKALLMKTAESNERMITLVNDMAVADRIDSKRFKPDFIPVSPYDVLQNLLLEMHPLASKKGINFSIHNQLALQTRAIIGPNDLRAVLQNLLENAIRYTREGGNVGLGLSENADTISCIITDTGIGIPEADQKYIFKRFYRAQNAVKMETDGSGLGLYLVRSIVDAYGGMVSFTSKEGIGSTFTITLPKARS